MTALAKIKLLSMVNNLAQQNLTETNLISKIKRAHQIRELFSQLAINAPMPALILPENPSKSDLGKAVSQWLKENLQGKSIVAVDGSLIHFNRSQSTEHLSYDARRSILAAKAIGKIIEVFKEGQFLGRQELSKTRPKDDFIAFYRYQKWVEIDGYRLLLETKAGERKDGTLESLPHLIAYTQKIAAKESQLIAPNDENIVLDGFKESLTDFGIAMTQSGLKVDNISQTGSKCDTENNIPILDNAQDENLATLTILEVTDLEGNPISFEETTEQATASGQISLTYNQGSQSQRQKENDAASAIVKSILDGELAFDDISAEQKAILAKYSGNGAGMKDAITGKVGSQYEYYTPPVVAGAMWDLLIESGFNGGKVLDPCAGTGVFSSVAPQNALIDSVELSEVVLCSSCTKLLSSRESCRHR